MDFKMNVDLFVVSCVALYILYCYLSGIIDIEKEKLRLKREIFYHRKSLDDIAHKHESLAEH